MNKNNNMNEITEKFNKFTLKTETENKKYENCEVTAENFRLPHIYLTEEEIAEINEECKRSGIDLKVIPLSDYLKFSPNNERQEINHKMKVINNTFIQKINNYEDEKGYEKYINFDYKFKYVNDFLGKKHKNYDDGEDSDEKDDDISNISRKSFSYKSNVDINRIQLEKSKLISKRVGKSENRKSKLKENEDEKKIIKKKKNKQKKNNKNIHMNKMFGKVIDSAEQKSNEGVRKKELKNKILEKSQYLTKEGLEELASKHNIRLVGDQFSEDVLNQRNIYKLENLLVDIETNSNLYKLETNRKDNIKTIKNKEEWERKLYEKGLKKKKMIEERKKNETNNNHKNKEENKKDSEEIQSEESYDIDSLN